MSWFCFWLCVEACEILVPQPGMEPVPLQWTHGVFTTGQSGSFSVSLVLTQTVSSHTGFIQQYFWTFTYPITLVWEGNGNPLQHSCLGNSMDEGAWWATVHGVAKSWTGLSDFASPSLTCPCVKATWDSCTLFDSVYKPEVISRRWPAPLNPFFQAFSFLMVVFFLQQVVSD